MRCSLNETLEVYLREDLINFSYDTIFFRIFVDAKLINKFFYCHTINK